MAAPTLSCIQSTKSKRDSKQELRLKCKTGGYGDRALDRRQFPVLLPGWNLNHDATILTAGI